MKQELLDMAVSALVASLLSNVNEESVRRAFDSILDRIENIVADTENKYDDAAILPVVDMVRTALSIPDND